MFKYSGPVFENLYLKHLQEKGIVDFWVTPLGQHCPIRANRCTKVGYPNLQTFDTTFVKIGNAVGNGLRLKGNVVKKCPFERWLASTSTPFRSFVFHNALMM